MKAELSELNKLFAKMVKEPETLEEYLTLLEKHLKSMLEVKPEDRFIKGGLRSIELIKEFIKKKFELDNYNSTRKGEEE